MAKTSLALREANAIVRARTRYQGRRHHSRRKFELPMAVVAGFAPITYYTFKAWRTQGGEAAIGTLAYGLLGYSTKDGTWSFGAAVNGWTPIIAGALVHKAANLLGINRALSRAKIPVIRI